MSVLTIVSNVITIIFFLVVISYYILIFIKPKKKKLGKLAKSISIIIPAYNEERFIEDCLTAVNNAKFNGDKQIIIVDDGSKDKTLSIIKATIKKLEIKTVKIIKINHKGKSNAINTALEYATGELIAIVDADSNISEDSLLHLTRAIAPKEIAGVCGVIRLENNKKFLGLWLHIEQLYNSLIRMLLSKIHANIVTPGPLSVYKREALNSIGGFSTNGFSEDVDVTIRLIRKGYKIGFSEKSITSTNMPYTVKGFLKQRTRFARGWLNIFGKHMKAQKTIIDIYSLPLMLFSYVQAVIMSVVTLYNVINGYIIYFYDKGIILSFEVAKYLFEWFSVVGTVRWISDIITGVISLDFIITISLLVTLISYPLYLIAIFKYDKKITLWHIIPLFFMFPFWLIIMIIYTINIPHYFKKHQYNIWEKQN